MVLAISAVWHSGQMFGAEGYEVVAINDLTNPTMLAHLFLKYDSAQGRYEGHTVEAGGRFRQHCCRRQEDHNLRSLTLLELPLGRDRCRRSHQSLPVFMQ